MENLSTLLGGNAAVHGAVVGNTGGNLLGVVGSVSDAENLAAVMAVVSRDFATTGETLGLGAFVSAVLTMQKSVRVLALQRDAVALVEMDRAHPTALIESALREGDWSSNLDSAAPDTGEVEIDFVSDLDVEPESPSTSHPALDVDPPQDASSGSQASALPTSDAAPRPPVPPPPTAVPRPRPASARLATGDLPPLPGSHGVDDKRRTGARPPVAVTAPLPRRAPTPTPLSTHDDGAATAVDDTWDEVPTEPQSATAGAFRWAIAHGDVHRIELAARELFGFPAAGIVPPSEEPGTRTLRDALAALLNGIVAALAGDPCGAISSFGRAPISEAIEPSVRWGLQLWAARAELLAGRNLDLARAAADGSLAISQTLDTEAEGLSLYAVAEVAFAGGDHERVLDALSDVSERLAAAKDTSYTAKAWLLMARSLAKLGRDEDSRGAADRAESCHPSWFGPALFRALRALEASDLSGAEELLNSLQTRPEMRSVEVERARRLLDEVKQGRLTGSEAARFLEIVEGQPTAAALREVEAFTQRLPQCHFMSEAHGWMLLRAGEYERAEAVFRQVSLVPDLAPQERSSALLALGCLATVRSRTEHTGTRLRAAVLSVPDEIRNSPSSRPGALPSSMPSSERKAASVRAVGLSPDDRSSHRTGSSGPAFTGDLQHFCLPDLLELLRSGQRTGTLVCASEAGVGAIHLRSGKITGAAGPNVATIGRWLVERGALTETQLQSVAEEEGGQKRPLGTKLIERRMVTPDLIREALRAQITGAIREIMGWPGGQFAFDPEVDGEDVPSDVVVELDPRAVLLNLFKELDESRR